MTMALLPSFFVLQATSGGQYLSVPEDLPETVPSGFLKFQENQIWSPSAKFEVEQANTEDDTLVHIRSCYTNKYWVVHKIDNDYFVVATGDKPNEDQTDPSCTLFQPQQGDQGVHLFSVALNMYASNSGDDTGDQIDGLRISDSKVGFNVVDWESLVFLPSQVSFKAEAAEGKYLCSRVIDTSQYLSFESGLEPEDPLVVHDLIPTVDGNYRIKDLNSGKFWREGPSKWILDDGEENDSVKAPDDMLFSFVKISGNVFAIRSLGSKSFCGMDTIDGKTDCLNARYPFISNETRLVIEERVVARIISNLNYRLSNARIYNKENLIVSQSFASNGLNTAQTTTLTFVIDETRTTFWTNNASVAPNINVNLDVTSIPLIENDETIKLLHVVSGMYQWGVVHTVGTTKRITYTVTVPPLTTLKVTVGCTRATCNVPFSYTQRDVRVNGQVITSAKNDGVFTGSNYYKFYAQTSTQGKNDEGELSPIA